jgi:hypothetical protein
MQVTLHIDVEMPVAFLPAQKWYPERELLERVAEQAVQSYIRNVVDLHAIKLSTLKGTDNA